MKLSDDLNLIKNGKKEFENFKLIPLLHPTWANKFMNYDIYRNQLKEIFQLVLSS
jgi:hypothetical protein